MSSTSQAGGRGWTVSPGLGKNRAVVLFCRCSGTLQYLGNIWTLMDKCCFLKFSFLRQYVQRCRDTCRESAGLLCGILDITRPIWTVIVIITAHTTARDGAVLIPAFLGAREIQFGCGSESYCKEAEGEPSALLLPWSCICDALDTCSSQSWSLAYARVQRCCLTLFSKARASPGRATPARAPGGRALQHNVGPLVVPMRLFFLCHLSHLGARAEQPCTGTKHSFAGIAAITPGSPSPAWYIVPVSIKSS